MANGLGFYVGNLFIAYYGLMITAGLAFASLIGWFQVKKFGKKADDFILIAAISGLCGIIGAKLLYILVSLDKIDFGRLTDLTYLNSIMSGGFVFYGGLLGGFLGFLICRRALHLDVYSYLEICIPCLPAAHAFGRIGCSLAGCCYGRPYDGCGAVIYENSLFAPNHLPLFPVQLTEAVFNFAVTAVLILYIDVFRGKRALELYLFLYALIRFTLEFFRFDSAERGVFARLSTSQYISIGLIISVIISSLVRRKKRAFRRSNGQF